MIIAIFRYSRFGETNSEQMIQLMCSEKKQLINEKLLNVEQSVNTIYNFIMEQMEDAETLIMNEEELSKHIDSIKELMQTSVKYTDGAVTVYYRLNPELEGPKQGIWLVRSETGEFVEYEMTDLSIYDKNDMEHVGWYYVPIENKKETWLNPYYNENMGISMISYVIPVIKDDLVIGVIGMDITTELLYKNTSSVTLYDEGYAFLMDSEGNFLYHPEMEGNVLSKAFDKEHEYLYQKSLLSAQHDSVEKYQWNNIDKRLATQELCNGMLFSVCVTDKEIREPQKQMFINFIWVTAIVVTIFILITIHVAKAIVKLAYTDTLTGLKNKTAYKEMVDNIDKKITNQENIRFAVIVIDINDLKKVNDALGHEHGDLLIQDASDIIKHVWSDKEIYRIGGDEFVVIILDNDIEKLQRDINKFEKQIIDFRLNNKERNIHMDMAIGMAIYDVDIDSEFVDVFRKADIAMYDNKKQKKKKRNKTNEGEI